MGHRNSVFHQVLANLPWGDFNRSVARHGSDKGTRTLDTRTQLVALLYHQVSGNRGLRRLVDGYNSQHRGLYHLGAAKVSRSTLSDANAVRPPEVFADVFAALLARADGKLAGRMRDCVYLVDSTTLRLNRLSGGWARFSKHVWGAKAHIVYDPDADMPIHAVVTAENVNDITAAKAVPVVPGSTYVFDLGYYDFGWWAELDAAGCRIVTRFKANTKLSDPAERLVEPGGPVLSDRTGLLPARQAWSRRNPMAGRVREVRVRTETGKILRLFTNDLSSPAAEISALYKRRWAIELFFRWVKQALNIRRFVGVSENAVRLQVAAALIAFLLLRIAQRSLDATVGALEFATLVRHNLMHRRTLRDLFGMPEERPPPDQRQAGFAWV